MSTISPEQEQERTQQLASELRCLVCQNQTIAESNSALAMDLRKQITEQIHRGKSDADIKQYMVERYGEFILYQPPFNAGNAALWLGPFVLLLIGVILAWRIVKRNAAKSQQAQQDPERVRAIEQRYQQDRNTDL